MLDAVLHSFTISSVLLITHVELTASKKHLSPVPCDFRGQDLNIDTLLLLCLHNMNLSEFYFQSTISLSLKLAIFEISIILLYSYDFKIFISGHMS